MEKIIIYLLLFSTAVQISPKYTITYLAYAGNAGAYIGALTVLASAATFWSSLKVLEKQKRILYDLIRAPWLHISVGLGLWLVASTTQLVFILLAVEPPDASFADIVKMLGYSFMIAGLSRSFGSLASLAKKTYLKRRIVMAYALPITLGAVLLTISLGALPQASLQGKLASTLISTAYIILDIALFTLSLEGTAIFLGGEAAKGLTIFSAGLALLAVSHLPHITLGSYNLTYILDLINIVSNIVMATGIYLYSKQPLTI